MQMSLNWRMFLFKANNKIVLFGFFFCLLVFQMKYKLCILIWKYSSLVASVIKKLWKWVIDCFYQEKSLFGLTYRKVTTCPEFSGNWWHSKPSWDCWEKREFFYFHWLFWWNLGRYIPPSKSNIFLEMMCFFHEVFYSYSPDCSLKCHLSLYFRHHWEGGPAHRTSIGFPSLRNTTKLTRSP